VHKGANSTETYFPAGTWYNLYNYTAIDASSGAKNVTVQVRPYSVPAEWLVLDIHEQMSD